MMLNMFVCMHYGLLLLMYLWTTLSGVDAALPRYCGRRGSGVDALGAPAGDLDLVQIQVVTRHGARTPTGDCARWLPGARMPTPAAREQGAVPVDIFGPFRRARAPADRNFTEFGHRICQTAVKMGGRTVLYSRTMQRTLHDL